MAIKKSDLYSSLWASCDELRGGMDASQYKDYVLFMLFIKYVSDKYADSEDFAPPVVIPAGASFADMVQLKGKADIGDRINTDVIAKLVESNSQLARSDFPDFNDPNKLGEGQAMVDRLTNLISIFQKPELNFSQNRADHDDILGDAYEYLMRHFATESGKSKGQFYTPSEVSQVMAKVLGIAPENTVAATTAYDPTCGSGSLLLKVAAEAGRQITLEGQEKDVTTAGLARMNMILHDFPTATILSGNTLAAPKFLEGEAGAALRTYDYVVANPPFSDKTWSTGLKPDEDRFQRFEWGVPPGKQGDYAYLLHIIRSLKSTGKGACILPHGVLFRGNAEAVIRRQLVQSGYLKGVIGLPANLFYGTGIPACILVLDKENAQARRGVFMIDAAKGFKKDGNKNRLREQDIHRIVDTFKKQAEVPRYARMVPFEEIADPKNDYNLNLPRYIDSTEPEDLQDIAGHLWGGIPERDIEALGRYWAVMPGVRSVLFAPGDRPGYGQLRVAPGEIKGAILDHAEFGAFRETVTALFGQWRERNLPKLQEFDRDSLPKALIGEIAEDLLTVFRAAPLIDAYDVYQHLLDYWAAGMQDDCYLIAAEGWTATAYRIQETVTSGKNKGDVKDKGWACDLLPKALIVAEYFDPQQQELERLQGELESVKAEIEELKEEYGGEEGILQEVSSKKDGEDAYEQAVCTLWAEQDGERFGEYNALREEMTSGQDRLRAMAEREWFARLKNKKGGLTLKAVKDRLAKLTEGEEFTALSAYVETDGAVKQAMKRAKALFTAAEGRIRPKLKADPVPEELQELQATVRFLALLERQSELGAQVKAADAALDQLAYGQYGVLTPEVVRRLVIERKWLPALEGAVQGELERVSQGLTGRVRELAERYGVPLPEIEAEVAALSATVAGHLERMGFGSSV